MSFYKPSARDAVRALNALSKVEVPEGGDVDGEPINSPNVLSMLPPSTQQLVIDNTEIVSDYLRKNGDDGPEENKRGLRAINRTGRFQASLNADQYDQTRLVGQVGDANFHIDISDPSGEEDD